MSAPIPAQMCRCTHICELVPIYWSMHSFIRRCWDVIRGFPESCLLGFPHSWSHEILYSCIPESWIPGYSDSWIPGFQISWIPGLSDPWIPGSPAFVQGTPLKSSAKSCKASSICRRNGVGSSHNVSAIQNVPRHPDAPDPCKRNTSI